MSYKNAEDVLPTELIREIQKYVDGEVIYIPRKSDKKRSWGDKNGTRDKLTKRNRR